MGIEKGIFQRTELLVGNEVMKRISETRVIIFGIGGVGSWCAESLVRSGIHYLTIVDSDRICTSNINRQLHATTKTVGQVKTDVLKNRLLEINPKAEITAIQQIYNADTSDSFELHTYDYIIDAIDSLSSKAHLIREATKTDGTLFSSMGASLKADPTKIKTAEFWKVQGCPLGSALRAKIRKGELPAKKFLCVYSEELLKNKGISTNLASDELVLPSNDNIPGVLELADHDWNTKKAQINGTFVHITAIFGFTLAGLVMTDIMNKAMISE